MSSNPRCYPHCQSVAPLTGSMSSLQHVTVLSGIRCIRCFLCRELRHRTAVDTTIVSDLSHRTSGHQARCQRRSFSSFAAPTSAATTFERRISDCSNRFGATHEGNTTSGQNSLFDHGARVEHLQVVLVCFFGFGLGTHADHGYAACEFRKTFLEFSLS